MKLSSAANKSSIPMPKATICSLATSSTSTPRQSMTEERAADLNKIDFASLPLDKAIKEVRGNGKLKVAVFSDPDCPYCKRLEHEFEKMTDITIYTFMMPIPSLHPDAARKAELLWCQPNPTQAWIDWMRKGNSQTAKQTAKTCC